MKTTKKIINKYEWMVRDRNMVSDELSRINCSNKIKYYFKQVWISGEDYEKRVEKFREEFWKQAHHSPQDLRPCRICDNLINRILLGKRK